MSENKRRRTKDKKESNSKPKKKKNIIWRTIKFLIIFFILIGFIGAGAAAGLVVATLKDIEPIDVSQIDYMLDENSEILDQDGNLLEKIQNDGIRTIVTYDEIDEDLKNAFIATEDRTFEDHHGFNFKRLVGSVIEAIKTQSSPRGTSTITQQLARNLYLPHIKSEKTISRKIKEAYYAVELEKYLTKDQIFEYYMNTIYLGSGAKGVEAAAQTYFSKSSKDLDLVESALVAGITQSPTRHSPFTVKRTEDVTDEEREKGLVLKEGDIYTTLFNESSYDRYHSVLGFMKVSGYITDKEYDEAMEVDLKSKLKPGNTVNENITSFFSDFVEDEVIETLQRELSISDDEANDMLYTQGLKIYSTLDLNIQQKLESIYKDEKNFPAVIFKKDDAGNIKSEKSNSINLYKYENLISDNNSLIIPKGDYKYNSNGDLVLLRNKRLYFYQSTNNNSDGTTENSIDIFLKDACKYNEDDLKWNSTYGRWEAPELYIHKGGRITGIENKYKELEANTNNLIISSEFLNANPDFFKKDNSENLLISNKYYNISAEGSIQPQSAMVIIDYNTGEIKALVGGRQVKGQKLYNRANHPRQPGSAIKPLSVYTPAMDNGWTAASIIDDIPNYDANGNRWPKNWYEKASNPKGTGYWGLSTLREALKWSMNVPPVKIVERLGVETSFEYLKKLGITTLIDNDQNPRTNDENLASMALGGMTRGISPLELTSAYGTLGNGGIHIEPHSFTKITDRNGNTIFESKPTKNFVVSPQVSFLLTDMMRSGVEAGTGTRARLENMPVAGKTGTTSDNFDAWFAGYTPYYVGGVWIGNDLQIMLDSGSSISATLWKKVMEEIHKDLPEKEFEQPEGIIRMNVDTISGKLPTKLSNSDPRNTVKSEYFIEGTQPTEFDDVHVELNVCTETGKLATEYCPETEFKVFVSRPVPYNPAEHNGFIPRDYPYYEAPSETCDIHTSAPQPNGLDIEYPPGTITLPNGVRILPDGRKVLPNGTIVFPDGTVIEPSPSTQQNSVDNDTTDNENNNTNDLQPDDNNNTNDNFNNVIDSNENNLIDSNN